MDLRSLLGALNLHNPAIQALERPVCDDDTITDTELIENAVVRDLFNEADDVFPFIGSQEGNATTAYLRIAGVGQNTEDLLDFGLHLHPRGFVVLYTEQKIAGEDLLRRDELPTVCGNDNALRREQDVMVIAAGEIAVDEFRVDYSTTLSNAKSDDPVIMLT